MTKQEAIENLINGFKMTHQMFTPEEWMKLEGNTVYFEDGNQCSWADFWDDRDDKIWEDHWSRYDE